MGRVGRGGGEVWNPADPELRHWEAPSCSLSLLSSLQALLVPELPVRRQSGAVVGRLQALAAVAALTTLSSGHLPNEDAFLFAAFTQPC